MNGLSRNGARPDGAVIAPRPVPAEPVRVANLTRTPTNSAANWLAQLVQIGLLSDAAVQSFRQFHGQRLAEFNTSEKMGRALVAAGLLTNFQLQRVLAGQTHGLVLGNYRVLDKLGSGS